MEEAANELIELLCDLQEEAAGQEEDHKGDHKFIFKLTFLTSFINLHTEFSASLGGSVGCRSYWRS